MFENAQTPEHPAFSVFREYLPEAEIEECAITDLPAAALEYFEFKSSQFISADEYKPGAFEKIFVVKFPGGKTSYLAQQTKTYETTGEREKQTFIADVEDGEVTGVAELRFNVKCAKKNKAFFKDKPFIGWTETRGPKKTGAGTRRAFLMNAIARMCYGLPLYSDTLTSADMKKLWEKLTAQGKARKFKEDEVDRYVLLPEGKNN
jgi:hypothetical protein